MHVQISPINQQLVQKEPPRAPTTESAGGILVTIDDKVSSNQNRLSSCTVHSWIAVGGSIVV